MEKMIWAKPEMNEIAFAANEYVSLCLLLTCNLMGNHKWVDTNENTEGGTPVYGDGNVTWGNDISEIHQYDQCGAGSSAGGAWFNTVTQKESGTNGASVIDVWLDANKSSDDGYELAVNQSTSADILRQITTEVAAIWTSVLSVRNGRETTTYHFNHVGTAVFQEKNANNS